MNRDVLCIVRTFLTNREIIHTLLVCREWYDTRTTALFTSLTVRPTDDLMLSIRRFIQHKPTLRRTVLYRINVEEEWPFETAEMVLIGCVVGKDTFSPRVKKCRRLKYNYEFE